MNEVVVAWSPRLQAYNPSDDAERPMRRGLAWDLLQATGATARDGVLVVDPPRAPEEWVTRLHTSEYVEAVRRYSADPREATALAAFEFGFIPGMDTIATPGMHEAALDVCGSALAGARAVSGAVGRRSMCLAPAGLHHAHPGRASGFCLYNDCAVAIAALLEGGADRVAYVDIDAHHGDGVQAIFWNDPRVLTISVHEFAHGFYPGTGGLDERGGSDAVGTALNIPLPPFSGDAPYLAALEQVVAPAVRAFAPDVIVAHWGVDVHHADPMTHLQVTTAALEVAYVRMVALADEACEGRLQVLTGGGYNPANLGRFWALQLGALTGDPLEDALPDAWRAAAREALGDEPPSRLREDAPPEADVRLRDEADRAGAEVVAKAAQLLRA